MFFFLLLVAKTHVGDNPSEISSLPMRFIYERRNISALCKYMYSRSYYKEKLKSFFNYYFKSMEAGGFGATGQNAA